MKGPENLRKVKIDERQQADLNRVTGIGYWIGFYLLLLAIIVEGVFLGRPFREWAVEWGIFMLLAIYELVACIRTGVWTPNIQKPTVKSCAAYSLAGGMVCAVMFTLAYYFRSEMGARTVRGVISFFAVTFLVTAVMLFVFFLAAMWLFTQRRMNMEKEMEKEETGDEGRG